MQSDEIELIRKRYARREANCVSPRYAFVRPAVYLSVQERERALMRWIRDYGIEPIASRRLIEIGCGTGLNLLEFLRFGFQPENLVGNELLPMRVAEARHRLPESLAVVEGDALQLEFADESFDVVSQFGVFSSILDTEFQNALAAKMWRWATPGGGVLWYDFMFDNPRNPDVRGVRIKRIKELFPEGRMKCWRTTLAPPISRLVTRVHPSLYTIFNAAPFLRTHVLCWIPKENDSVRR